MDPGDGRTTAWSGAPWDDEVNAEMEVDAKSAARRWRGKEESGGYSGVCFALGGRTMHAASEACVAK
jgi:hypothetical protein